MDMYELVQTDAWRHLRELVAERKAAYEHATVTAAKRSDFVSTDIAKVVGGVIALEELLGDMKETAKHGKDEG